MPSYDTVVWLPNALVLTGLLAAFTTWRWRRAGVVSGLRWAGVTLVPLSLYFTGLLRLIWSIFFAVSRWVTGFVFHPTVWLGVILAVIALLLMTAPGRLRRVFGADHAAAPPRVASRRKSAKAKPDSATGDDDMAEIEEILKRRGIE
ncbi:MAG: hypothetical protein ACR2KG_07265 [Nocardioidaceae bacterium]